METQSQEYKGIGERLVEGAEDFVDVALRAESATQRNTLKGLGLCALSFTTVAVELPKTAGPMLAAAFMSGVFAMTAYTVYKNEPRGYNRN